MKSLLKYLDLEMDIGWHHFAISKIIEEYNKKCPTNPLDKEIDKVTGYGEIRDKETVTLLLGHLTRLLRKLKKMKEVFNQDYPTDKVKTLISDLNKIKRGWAKLTPPSN